MKGTLRERVKVQRDCKSSKTAIREDERIYYNFVKAHEKLDGKTLEEKAGINLKKKNK